MRNVPFPIEVIICGQYIWIAIPVKKAARSGLMPLSVTLDYTDAMVLPGSTSIGQIDSPSEVVAAGSLKPMPALDSASRNEVSVVGSACAGAAIVTAVATPTKVTVRLRFALFTGATLVYSGHIDYTVV